MEELARRCNDMKIVSSLRGVDVLDHPQTKPLRGRMAKPIDMVKGEITSASADGGSEESTGGIARISRISIRSLAVALFFGGTAAFVRALLGSLPPDFFDRWKRLINDQPLQEPKPVLDPQPGTVIYDCHGVIIATIVAGGYSGKRDPSKCKKEKQAPLHPSEIPSTMWQAVVASEDRRFFEHHGIDPRGLARAILSLASSGGGSTITQQVRIAWTFFFSYLIYREVLPGSSFVIPKYSIRVGFGWVLYNVRLPCGNISRIILQQKPKQEALYDIRPLTLRIHVLLDDKWCRSYQIDRIFSHFTPYQNNHGTLSSIKVDMNIRDVVCIEDCKLRRRRLLAKA
jgi:hypothetical protein